ncbi:MAG TPA: ribosome biogenesis GTPase Der [Patescibacteria group bacterium]|nr:ribosome biogenesis GTPase Der [Patescibacteria group bacterium]
MQKKYSLPIVTLIGRMNVGKSTLFNRLTETKYAITSSLPGTTRDVKNGAVVWRGMQFSLQDSGGLDVKEDEQLEKRVIAAAQRAASASAVILFIVDGKTGVLQQDTQLFRELQQTKKPIIVVVNKIDDDKQAQEAMNSIHQLGNVSLMMISARNGRGTGDLLDAIYHIIGAKMQAADREDRTTKVAIVGRPNVGKSSLLNAILGEERVMVADKAHTTRDTNDIPYEYKGKPFVLIDTAGIRKRARVGSGWKDKRVAQIEKESVRGSMSAIERADVVLLVLEAHHRISDQDKKIAQLTNELGKGFIVVLNKWDLVEEKETNTINDFVNYFDAALPFLRWVPMIFISAKDSVRVRDVLDMVVKVTDNYSRMLTTEQLHPVLDKVKAQYHPRVGNMRKYKKPVAVLKSLRQTDVRPPRFYFRTNKPKDIPKAIPRILERELRDAFDFSGVKIIIETGS